MARARRKVVLFKKGDEVYIQYTEKTLKEMAEKLAPTIGAWRNRAARKNEPKAVPAHLDTMIKQFAALKEIKPEKVYSVVQASSRIVSINVEGTDVDIPIKNNKGKIKVVKV